MGITIREGDPIDIASEMGSASVVNSGLFKRGWFYLGDAKTENALVDTDDNAWIVDGGESTRDWVGRETIEGDQEGLSRIEGLLYQE